MSPFVPHPVCRIRTLVLAAVVACLAVAAGAQGRGAGGGRDGFGGRGGAMGNDTRLPSPPSSGANTGGMQLGPPGRWWDNKEFARTIGLNTIQQRRMDDVFTANRDNLMRLDRSLQHEESQLKKLTRSQTLDENLIYQQIDRVTLARGELEKGYAHMTLQIRKEMTPEQTIKLDEISAVPQ